MCRIRADGLEEETQQADSARPVTEGNVCLELQAPRRQIRRLSEANEQLTATKIQLILTNEQLTAEVKNRDNQIGQLNEDKQFLWQQLNTLREETRSKETQLHWKQRANDSRLHRETEEQHRALEQIRVEKGELEQRVDEMEQLLRDAEAASKATERRLRVNKQVLKDPACQVQLSDNELKRGSFRGVPHLPVGQAVHLFVSVSVHVCLLSSCLEFSKNCFS